MWEQMRPRKVPGPTSPAAREVGEGLGQGRGYRSEPKVLVLGPVHTAGTQYLSNDKCAGCTRPWSPLGDGGPLTSDARPRPSTGPVCRRWPLSLVKGPLPARASDPTTARQGLGQHLSVACMAEAPASRGSAGGSSTVHPDTYLEKSIIKQKKRGLCHQ